MSSSERIRRYNMAKNLSIQNIKENAHSCAHSAQKPGFPPKSHIGIVIIRMQVSRLIEGYIPYVILLVVVKYVILLYVMSMNMEDEMEVGLAMVLIIIFCSIDKVVERLHILWHKPDSKYESRFPSSGSGIEYLDTMNIPHSGYSAEQRRAEYMRRGQSPSGFINGVYNDQNRPRNVPYYDGNRDWDADT
jgi:hypothetical protein